jgi:hypothetical protein
LAARIASHSFFTWLNGQLGRPRLALADLLGHPRRHHRDEAGGAAGVETQGTHPKYVQELLGHVTIAIYLDIYSHVIPSMSDLTVRIMQDALPRG